METRELGRSGISVSRIILGCGNFGGVGSAPAFFGQGIPHDEAPRIMDAAWELGITQSGRRSDLVVPTAQLPQPLSDLGSPVETLELGRSGISVSRIVLGCGNFGGVGSAPAFFGQGIPREEAPRIMDAAWELGITTFDTADAYGGGRSETWIGEWLADEGLGGSRRDHDRDEDVQPDGRGRGSRAVTAADPTADRVEPRAAGHRAHTAVHGPRARCGHTGRGDARGVRRARAGRHRGRGRRVQLHGRAAR